LKDKPEMPLWLIETSSGADRNNLHDHTRRRGRRRYDGIPCYRGVRLYRFLDRQKLRDAIHNHTFCVKDHPGILMDVYYDDKGDIDRESFIVETVNGKHVVTGILPPLNPERFRQCR
jgi:hypothetical protein